MNRRGFLRRIGKTALGVALAPIAAKLLPLETFGVDLAAGQSKTNFAMLTPKQKVYWSRDQWSDQRMIGIHKPVLGDADSFGVIGID